MPKVGKEEFAYTQEGIAEAKAMSEETGTPVTNAPDRVQKYQSGGMTEPPTSPSITPAPSYKKGGKVSVGEKTRKLNYEATEASIKRMKEKSLAGKHFKPVNPYKRSRDKAKGKK